MTAAAPTRAQSAARTFAAHRGALLDLLAQIPEERADFTPWTGAMSFVRLADHLDGSARGLLAGLGGVAPSRDVQASATLAEARARLMESSEQVQAAVSALDDDALARVVPAFGGRQMPLSAFTDLVTQHEAHHKGQVWLMARMVGVQPPFFLKLG